MERIILNSSKFFAICFLLATLTEVAVATMEEDEKDCAEQMANLASCMPYVSGSAKTPTPECCEDTVKVRSAKPKCLCVLIKESTDPSMGLPINTTLALQMPALCKIDAKVSDCPAILKLPPNSPDAKIFQVDSSTGTSNSPVASASSASSTSPSSSTSSSSSSSDTKTTTGSSSSSNVGGKLGQSILMIIALILL